MMFRDVIGQQEVKQHLVEMVEHNRLSHALLFVGKEGSGALPLAHAFAQYVSLLPNKNAATTDSSLFGEAVETRLPSSADAADEWMQKQPAFSKSKAMVHPDIHFSYPVIKRTTKSDERPISTDWAVEWREFLTQFPYGNVYDWLQFMGAENKQGNITAYECNDIIRKLSLKSFENGYKILLMWMPEYLGKEGNKLLKLIEEPPLDTLFLLVAESESNILSTIVSRCQLVRIPPIETSEVEKTLIEKAKVAPGQARQLSNICEGNYREALHLLQHADEDYQALLRNWLKATLKGPIPAQVKSIEEIARLGREPQKQFLKYFTHLVEQAIRLRTQYVHQPEHLLSTMSDQEQVFVPHLNKTMTLEQQDQLTRELEQGIYYIERNANAKILFHALTIKLHHIVKNNLALSPG